MDSTNGTLIILLVGVLVVVGSILVLRLHAFLALILAALVVAFLTPKTSLERFDIQQSSIPVSHVNDETLDIHAGEKQGLRQGLRYLILSNNFNRRQFEEVAEVEVVEFVPGKKEGEMWAQARILSSTINLESSKSQLSAIHPLELNAVKKRLNATIAARVANGFGSMCGKVGIIIAMAGIIGKCLLDSGAADRIVRTTLKWFGERGAPASFMISGFFLGIPVFFDTVFYLMIPLGKAMRVRTGHSYLLYVLTIVCGATMAHSLVPPTPGPLIVAEELGVDLGLMILVGGTVGLLCAIYGYFYATIINKYFELPLRETPDFSLAELEASMQVGEDELPPFWLAILPILLPVLLISMVTFIGSFPETVDANTKSIILTLGDKNIALIFSAALAMLMLVRQKRRSLQELSTSVQAALASAGVIILITAAGGAFGSVLRETGIEDLIHSLPTSSPIMLCVFGFLVTAAIRTAQGSATVAMITAAGIMSGIAQSGDLSFHPVYLAAAIGCGSKPVSWMNDSGFWVITRMSGMTETEGLKFIAPMTTSMGCVGLIFVLIGVTVLPNF